MTPIVSVDFETRSAADLRKTGVYVYANDASTDVWCMAYAFDDEEPVVWVPGDQIDSRLACHIKEGGRLRAWNAQFERVIWNAIMGPEYGWPRTKAQQWHCTMAAASAAGLPRSLGQAAAVLGVDEQKDKTGQALMMRMARPRKVNDDGTYTWWDQPEKVRQLIDYCLQDVRTEVAIAERLPDLDDSERQIYLLDQRINDRGLMLDRELLRHVRNLADASREGIDEEIRRLTKGAVRGATKGVELVTWLNKYGVKTKSVDKQSVTAMLSSDALHPVIRRVLELRQDGAKSSTAKLDAMENAAGSDDRMRGLLVYHGAATGRWSGKLVQPQNFPRPARKNPEIEEIIGKLKAGQSVAKHGAGTVLASDLLRSLLVAEPGHTLMFADYNAIEARVLAWMSKQTDLVATFAAGGDVYCDMAAVVFNTTADKIGKESDERQLGKSLVLGCFEEDTLVLTERGWIPILHLSTQDRVWDGEEWVTHCGIVYQGVREVHRTYNLGATPDHLVLTEAGWREWQEVHTNPSLLKSALSSANLPLKNGSTISGLGNQVADAHAVGPGSSIGSTYSRVNLHGVIAALNERAASLPKSIKATRILSQMISTASVYLTASLPASSGARTQRAGTGSTMGGGAYASTPNGYVTDVSSSNIWYRWMGGIYRTLTSTASTTTEVTSRIICALLGVAKTCLIDAAYRICKPKYSLLKRKSKVYDVSFAGPRNRFTVWSKAGPLIVHNCGFGMSGKRFAEFAKVDMDLALRAVAAYREKNHRIVAFWKETEARYLGIGRDAIAAGQDYMCVPLPSGRRLTYRNPRIVPRVTPWGEMRDTLQVDTLNSVTRQWVSQLMWGGLGVENLVQATARDLMAGAMMRLEMSGFPVVCSVHDEIICEVLDGRGSLTEMVQIMTEVPAWASGCPVTAEGKEGERYRK